MCYFVCCLFFFQAEDGIRDTSVTGVQTCALPILPSRCSIPENPPSPRASAKSPSDAFCAAESLLKSTGLSSRKLPPKFLENRSEERRVGKECRSRWATGE